MRLLNYNRLLEIYKAERNYRGTNEYPYDFRNHRYKYFIPQEVNGKIEFQICYWYEWSRVFMTPTEFHEKKGSMSKRELDKWSLTTDDNANQVFRKYTNTPRPLGIVRDDNTFEFTIDEELSQGDRYMLSQGKGYFQRSCRHGGTIWVDNEGGWDNRANFKRMPIFKGLRIYMDTMKPHESSIYTTSRKRIDRKKAKVALTEYDTAFTLCETMYKVISPDTFIEDFKATLKEYDSREDKTDKWWSWEQKLKLIPIARELFKSDPMGASYLYLKAFGSGHIDYYEHNTSPSLSLTPINFYRGVRNKLVKQIYVEHDAFTREIFTHEETMPSSTWAVDVKVNNQLVKRI